MLNGKIEFPLELTETQIIFCLFLYLYPREK
jgi:hypothetical protein